MISLVVALASSENQELPQAPQESPLLDGIVANQQCSYAGSTYELQDCYAYLTDENILYPPNSCCFVLHDLRSIDAARKSFTICQCLRTLVSDPKVISTRANVMAEGCSVGFSFDVFTGMTCS
ncbi:Non-specific lipid-transfer protein [Bienertia sinuspersici]